MSNKRKTMNKKEIWKALIKGYTFELPLSSVGLQPGDSIKIDGKDAVIKCKRIDGTEVKLDVVLTYVKDYLGCRIEHEYFHNGKSLSDNFNYV